ncbi:hypothetical protein DTO166G4_238 [Paecilomyces variotii]|uniref:adenosine deaminase n=1 Tax=Byssochlamys spectabilis TaxID=264951 RepID=A0A443HXW0_BYSSP|nr:putative CECR1 family adenosine deaminase [Paecilomyces variotii]KAJ9203145.1 hypothetical protein DTO164E3_2616 [Paecilomyces variotii]KAJ9208670.1 hypothetical protein DTO032I3_647 [Paecilomyces variotii]KAJ9218372.1 hypothetical protein DTO166G4_238 [Paecilomyces variotii]KAJ9223671.1 hypothetical protein DTO169C6_4023 [Paecilomyces variotii]KAJ9235875.1 hypothetical protein DTO166G5_4333 [Paecilomyces variotii]
MGSGDDEWELDEGIPQFGDPFIQKYINGREALIQEERKQRHDYTFRKSMSRVAAEASRIVSRIRAREQRDVWTDHLEEKIAHQSDEVLYPGIMFNLAKDRMEKTDLWKIVHRMPKGALLHAHMDAMFDLDYLIDLAFTTPGIHISAPQPLSSDKALDVAPVSFQFSKRPLSKSDNKPSIWTDDYEPSTLLHIQKAASTFPRGGESGFREWLKSRCMIAPDHSYNHHHGVDAIWAIFQRTFPVINSILFYEPILRKCLRRMLDELAVDGIKYVDFRVAFLFEYRRENSETPEDDYMEFLNVFEEEVEAFKATEKGARFHGARIIWTTLRRLPNRDIVESMKECIESKKEFPEIICGFDVVGQEDQGRPLVDMTPILFWFRKACAEEGVEIPFFFHAGECLGDGDATDNNLFDAILLGTRRIGHGFSLYKHPLLIDLVKEKKILIECCPISNEILRLTSSIKSHPLPALLSRGVPVSLCNDDPAVLGHGRNGLTHDFWQALQGLENMGLEGLAVMAENSIRWSCFEDQTTAEWQKDIRDGVTGNGVKAQRLREWYADFEEFCQWIVMEFADEGLDGDDN